MKNNSGFTLIELMIVVSIIGILAAIAIPQFSAYRKRAMKSEGSVLSGPVRIDVNDYYDHTGRFPKNNFECGIARPEYIKGKYVTSITVENGTITVLFNNKYLEDEYVKLIPEIIQNNPTGPLIWEVEYGSLAEKPNDEKEGTEGQKS